MPEADHTGMLSRMGLNDELAAPAASASMPTSRWNAWHGALDLPAPGRQGDAITVLDWDSDGAQRIGKEIQAGGGLGSRAGPSDRS